MAMGLAGQLKVKAARHMPHVIAENVSEIVNVTACATGALGGAKVPVRARVVRDTDASEIEPNWLS